MGARISILLLALMLGAPLAHAADDVATARKLFQSGTKHFDLGEYEAALSDFKEAYRIKDDPVLLYNIGQCHRMLKHNEEAIRAYKTYLSRSTDQTHRADVEQKVAALEEAIDKQNQASTIPPTGVLPGKPEPGAGTTTPGATAATTTPNAATLTAAPPARQPVYKKWWLWTAVGGVVVVGVAVGLGVGLSRGNGGNLFPNVSY